MKKKLSTFLLSILTFGNLSAQCVPDPYATQQTWWLPYGYNINPKQAVRIDFQTGVAVLNNPPNGSLGQGSTSTLGHEGNTTVTNPVTGEFLFGTDGNSIYRGFDGAKATGGGIGGHYSAEESAAVIPDPQGVLGRDFIVFGNTAFTSTIDDQGQGWHVGGLNAGKYNLQTNTITSVTNLIPQNLTTGITEALEVIPQPNGTDYWILVHGYDQYVKVYRYTAAAGFDPTPVSQLLVSTPYPNSLNESFISWIPQQPDKLVIVRGDKIGIASFNINTGSISNFQVKASNSSRSYSAALSPNGKYLYYASYNGGDDLNYIDLTTNIVSNINTNFYFPVNGIKVAPDGKIYFSATPTLGGVQNLYYVGGTADNPVNTYSQFNTGGRNVSMQLPNSAYRACELATCQAGNNAPELTQTIFVSPQTVATLSSLLSAANMPSNTQFSVHTASPATAANQLSQSATLTSGTTYYIAFWDEFYNCHSPVTAISVENAIGCTNSMYLSQNSSTTLYEIGTTTNPLTYNAIGASSGITYNAIGINPLDGIMYGMRRPGRTLIQINDDGTYVNLGPITNLPNADYNSGEIDEDGNFYVKLVDVNNRFYKIDLINKTATLIPLTSNHTFADFAYNPVTKLLYAVGGNNGQLYSIDPLDGTVTGIGANYGTSAFGAMFGSSTVQLTQFKELKFSIYKDRK